MSTRTTGTAAPSATTWERVGAAIYDPFLAAGERRGMAARRAALLSRARGEVLEIGAGTGLNLEHYPDAVTRLVLTEPVTPMARRVRARAGGRPRTEVLQARAEDLPVPTGSVDTVVSTMVLCTVGDVDAALGEVVRVLRPGGTLLFTEHVHAAGTRLGRWQQRLAGPWAAFASGCRCDRDLLGSIAAHLEVLEVAGGVWHGMPALVRPLVTGVAAVPA
jgi:SAM-dependent methyltransferase